MSAQGDDQPHVVGAKSLRSKQRTEQMAKADLRQAVWEASQFMEFERIAAFVAEVLREIGDDDE